MGIYDGIENAQTSKGGVYLEPGNYKLEVESIKSAKSRNKVDYFVVDFKILESDCAHRPVGSRVSWMTMDNNDAFLGNVKSFAAVAAGVPENEVTKDTVTAMIAEDQPLCGLPIRAQAAHVLTQKKTNFTKVFWSPVG